MIAITIDHLTHRYGKTTALDNISLTLPRGATVGLIGPDGVGKSTLLGIIAGVRRIQSGQVRVLDGDMTRARDRLALSHRIAYMPQGLGRNLYPTLSVYENIDFHARLFGLDRRERRARIQRLLDATGLAPFPDRAAGKLSGGMKQKVSLCCALVHSPDLLILDEPTTGVDPLSRRQFWALVHDLQQETTGMTTLVATAYIEEAEQFRQLLAMDAGKLLINAPTAATMRDYGCATLEETYIKLLPPEKQQGTGGLNPTPFVPDPHAPPAIEAHSLTKTFGDFTAVDHVSFTIEKGEIFGFLGSNGCGKTTTMKMLTGLLQASSGSAELLGAPVDAGSVSTRMRVGYMSQAFSLYEELTVRQNLELHARLYRLGAGSKAAISEALTQYDLATVAEQKPAALPLGIRQRLQLAAACLHRPEVLILDEPTSGVDPAARDMFWRHLLHMSREDKITIFVSTHFMNEAARCDRISFMHQGRVLAVGSPATLTAQSGAPNLEEAFIAYLIADEKQQNPATVSLNATNPVNTSLGTPSAESVGWASAHQTNPADATPSSISPEKPLPYGGGVGVGAADNPTTTTNASTISLNGANSENISLDAENPANIPLDTAATFIHAADPIPHPQDIAATSLKHPHPNPPPPAGEGADRTPLDATRPTATTEKPLPHGGGVGVGAADNPATTTNTSTTPLDAANPVNTSLDAANPANIPLDTAATFIHAADPIPHPHDIAATNLKHPHPNPPPPAGEGADRTPLGTPSIETVGGATFVENIAHAENPVTTPLDAANPAPTPLNATAPTAATEKSLPYGGGAGVGAADNPAAVTNTSTTPLDDTNPVNTPLNATAPAADTETIPSPACGGRRPEAGRGETANPTNTPLDGANPVNTPLNATTPAADTETIPSPACGGRWPEAGRGETANPANTSLDGASPVNTSLGAPKTATLRYWFATTWTFARREGTELLRDHVRTFFALFGPIILMTAITWGVSFDIKNLTYAVLDHDHSAESRAIIEPLAGSRYFNELPPLTDESQLLDRLASREAKLTIDIPPNFGRDLLRERRPEIHYHIDGAESFNAANINAYIPAILAAYTREQARARGITLPPPAASLEPRYAYNQDFKSVNAIAPGVLMLALTLFPAMMAAVGVVREREIGSIANYYTSPASRLQYLVGKQLPYITTAMLSFAILYLMMRYWFGLPMKGSLAALTLATLLMSCTSTAIGLLFSTFTRSQVAAIFLTAIATIMPALNFSGFLVPVSALEGGAHIFGKIIPSTWYAVTTTGTFSKGLGVHELHREILLLALYYAVFLTAACLNLKKQEK